MQAPESSLSPPPEPTWEVAHLFPPQGHWTESEFFELHSNRMVELADSAGAGGLIEDITHGKLPMRYAYLLIMLVTVVLTWETNVNGIITYASRAFALFYMLQCVVAFLVALKSRDVRRRGVRLATFAFLAIVCMLVFALGLPSE